MLIDEKLARGLTRQIARDIRKAGDEVQSAAQNFSEALGKRCLLGKRTRPRDFETAAQEFLTPLKDNPAVLYSHFEPMLKTRTQWAPGHVFLRILHPDKTSIGLAADATDDLPDSEIYRVVCIAVIAEPRRNHSSIWSAPVDINHHALQRFIERSDLGETPLPLSDMMNRAVNLAAVWRCTVNVETAHKEGIDVAIPAPGGALLGGLISENIKDSVGIEIERNRHGIRERKIYDEFPLVVALRTYLSDQLFDPEQSDAIGKVHSWYSTHKCEGAFANFFLWAGWPESQPSKSENHTIEEFTRLLVRIEFSRLFNHWTRKTAENVARGSWY